MPLKSYIQALLNTRTTKAQSANASMPSGAYVDLTVAPTLDSDEENYSFAYVAPTDGWCRISGMSTGAGFINATCYYVQEIARTEIAERNIVVSLPARKGANMHCSFREITLTNVRFSALNGASL